MTLVDPFNTFQKVSKRLKLSANARSLYIAILGEFNSAMFPETLNLSNAYLRDISGVNADSSFFSARNAITNCKLIRHKNQVYRLTPEKALVFVQGKDNALLKPPCSKLGEGLEPACSKLGASLEFSKFTFLKNKKEVEVDKDKETTTTTTTVSAHARENGFNSVEVQETWFRCEGQAIPGGMAYGLHELEKVYGVEALCKAILTASQNNKEHRLTFNFLKAVLKKQEGGNGNDGRGVYRADEGWGKDALEWLDS